MEGNILSEEKLRYLITRGVRNVCVPASIYRLQFNINFKFTDAVVIIPYLKEIGVDAVYCSPYFEAEPGSAHGYDVADPGRINPEIGTWEEFEQFCRTLKDHGMGHILDVVPNHMGIHGNNNAWWMDVLENGPASPFSSYFDIEWHPLKAELRHKVLLPVLGDLYGHVLESQEISLEFGAGTFMVRYYGRCFPIDPGSYPMILMQEPDDLRGIMRDDEADFREYLSIVTAFKNLPQATDADSSRVSERAREKEIAKQRLASLCARSPRVREMIANRVRAFNGRKGDPRSLDLLDQLLNMQSYRLALWSVAAQEINYRRFFDVNDLAAIRIEREEVFRHHHRLLFRLIRAGKVTGLRIDHPDGLYDPSGYFMALQREALLQLLVKEQEENARLGREEAEAFDEDAVRRDLKRLFSQSGLSTVPVFYIIVEKILSRHEQLPDSWNVHGTVGYDYLNMINGLFVERQNEEAFARIYTDFIGHTINFEDLVYNKKMYYGLVHMASEINVLGQKLDQISEKNRRYRDFTLNDLTRAIREVIACFPVYRTYFTPESQVVSDKDAAYIEAAVEKAKQRTPAFNPAVYDFLRDALLLRLLPSVDKEEVGHYRDLLLRFQQLTGPVMAKGLEDTSFYVYNRLISLNEVGGDPFCFGNSRREFDDFSLRLNKRWPSTVIASSTHDTKRSEDVRMRIDVLSEIPRDWNEHILRWTQLNEKFKTSIGGALEPRRNTEYFFYQTLIGAWPDHSLTGEETPRFIERIWQVMLKSIREAKIYTSWARPDIEYETAVERFIRDVLTPETGRPFLESFVPFQHEISFYGKLNSLSAFILKVACPGVADTFQGNEIWNYRLVDPDNRACVDYGTRRRLYHDMIQQLGSGQAIEKLIRAWSRTETDTLKLYVYWKGMNLRCRLREVLIGGEYLPLSVEGPRRHHVIAFLRKSGKKTILAAVGRFFTTLVKPEASLCFDPAVWEGTHILLPAPINSKQVFEHALTGETFRGSEDGDRCVIRMHEMFRCLPAGLLTCDDSVV